MQDHPFSDTSYYEELQIIADDLDIGDEGAEILATLDPPTRREFLKYAAAAVSVFALAGSSRADRLDDLRNWVRVRMVGAPGGETIPLKITVNGVQKTVQVDPRTVLLDALRERMGMTGTKKGCDHGQCGACTVLVEGRRVLSCLTLAMQVEGQNITTIEGLAKGDELHPVQEAFVKHDAYQCGYCTPGQICSAVGMLNEAKQGDASYVTLDVRKKTTNLSPDEIRERMSGNICRCGAYPKIVSAIEEAHSGKVAKQTWAFYNPEEDDIHDTV